MSEKSENISGFRFFRQYPIQNQGDKLKNRLQVITLTLSLVLLGCGSATSRSGIDTISDETSEKNLCPGAQPENSDGYGGGTGTKVNPYLICTVGQFKKIQGNMADKRFFRITSDIDFSNESNHRIAAISPFASIDGDNHKLTHITIKHGYGYKDNGIFGQLVKDLNGNRDEIKNLVIENVKVIGDGSEDGGGVIASANWGGVISNVHVTGMVQIEFPEAGQTSWAVGGIAGKNSWIIEDSSFDGEVSGVCNVGGITGLNEGIVRNSKSSGIVRGIRGVGGITGVQLGAGITTNNISNCSIAANRFSGALTGLVCNSNEYSLCGIRD